MMRFSFAHCFAVLVAALVFMMSSASLHHASYAADSPGAPQRNLATVDERGTPIRCGDVAEAKQGVLVGYIVPCVTYTIEKTTMRMSAAMIDWLQPVVYAFMSLVITLFGVRTLQGGGQLHGEAILLLLKIGLVIGLMEIIPTRIVPLLYDVMNEGLQIVSGTITPDMSSLSCDTDKFNNTQAPFVWAQMDCLTGKLFGIVSGTPGADGKEGPNMLLAASIFGVLGGFVFGGTFGVILFMTLIGVLWMTFMLILRTISAFLNGYLYASLLLIVAPLFLPLILLKATAQFFEPWWKGILAGILLPVIICCYTMFAMVLYDRMLFDDGKISGRPSLLHKLFDHDLMKKAQALPRSACLTDITSDPKFRRDVLKIKDEDTKDNPLYKMKPNPQLAGGEGSCPAKMPQLEVMRAMGTEDNRQAFILMFYDATKMLVLAILINMGYSNVASLARRLIGSGGVASTLDARGPIESKISALGQSVELEVKRAVSDKQTGKPLSGADFITSLKDMPEAVGRGIVGGLKRE